MLDKYEDAIVWLDKALAIDPKHVKSFSEKGRSLHSYINRCMFKDVR